MVDKPTRAWMTDPMPAEILKAFGWERSDVPDMMDQAYNPVVAGEIRRAAAARVASS